MYTTTKLRSIGKFRSHSFSRLNPRVYSQGESKFTRHHIMFLCNFILDFFLVQILSLRRFILCNIPLQVIESVLKLSFMLAQADVSSEFLFPLEARKICIPLYERDEIKYHSRCFQRDELLAKGETGLSHMCCQMMF